MTDSRAAGLPEDIAKVFRLDDQYAVVTGAASGLGKAIALGFAHFGANVACLDVNLEGAGETAAMISDLGRESSAMWVDVRDWESVRSATGEVRSWAGRVEVAVNVPGINRRKPVLELEPEEFSEVLDVNLLGLFHCAKAFGDLMVQSGRGRIINMASVFGLVAMECQGAYASSKGAVVQLTKVLALEFAPHNVQVNALAPAYFTTPLVRQIMEDSEWYEEVIRRIPQGRFGEVWEIVGPAVFLASRASSFVTGTTLLVDGGWTAAQGLLAVVIADTHVPRRARALPEGLIPHLGRADLILHAGDLMDPALLAELAAYAPVRAVRGNLDPPDLGLPETLEFEFGGAKVAMIHDSGRKQGRRRRLRRRFPDARVVVFGHSHTPFLEDESGLMLLNPGSSTDRRRQPRHTFALLYAQAGKVRAEIVPL